MFLDSIKQKVNIKYFMVAYLTLLLVFSAIASKQPMFIFKGILIVFIYSILDAVWTYIKHKMWYLPVSSWISALILGLAAWPDLPWYFLFLLPLLAVISKQLLHLGKMRHVFNPAGFALMASNFFVPAIAWWGASSGGAYAIIISLAGIFILWRQSRWHEFIAFALSYIFFLTVLFVSSGIIDAYQLAEIIKTRIFHGATIFFASIMLIEPITSQFPLIKHRMIYGSLVGFFAVLAIFLLQKFPQFKIDPLIFGLLLGNLTASLFFLPNAKKYS